MWFRDEVAASGVQNETGTSIEELLRGAATNVLSSSNARRLQDATDAGNTTTAIDVNATDAARMLLDPGTPVIQCPVPEACVIQQVTVPRAVARRFLG